MIPGRVAKKKAVRLEQPLKFDGLRLTLLKKVINIRDIRDNVSGSAIIIS